ncbi:hypothetical protein MTBPR1_50069 [Candidatus Terasakiella magnetica]|uniref:Uncharacterized protein n=1 Tax=Candidatus Terasakiella magnetica TaxID=1867952 RepID=A0A1C3RJ91_9PROT|nr:FecR domain-containing protein [Candidatus Terasakiella magnetica]SCA57313.1 hypothetical protein MTBPR1_50069 [Candidatus Terasakiella magnetica]
MADNVLFDLKDLGEQGVELAQLAGSGEAAGRIETVNGTVTVRRLNGESASLNEGDEIFMGDTLEVGPSGNVGLIFADDTTVALGEGAQMVIDEMVYDPEGPSGSMTLSVADGVFSFVSGQISKTQDEAMVLNTPVATIGVRGTKGAGVAAPEGSENQITLMAEEDGQLGEIIVRNDAGVQVLNQPNQSVAMTSRFEAPPPPTVMSAAQIENMYGSALSVMPPPPKRRDEANEDGNGEGEEGENAEGEEAVEEGEEVAEGEAGEAEGEGEGEEELAAEEELAPEEEALKEEAPQEGDIAPEAEPMFAEGGPLGEKPVGEPLAGAEGEGDLIGAAGEDRLSPTEGGPAGEDVGLDFGDLGLPDPGSLLDVKTGDIPPPPPAPVPDPVAPIVEDPVVSDPVSSGTTITGTSAAEQRLGTDAAETFHMGAGDDWAMGDHGDDTLYGEAGNDVLYGDEPIIGRISTDDNGLEISPAGSAILTQLPTNLFTDDGNDLISVFVASSSALVSEDTNSVDDVYVKIGQDLVLGSANAAGDPGNAASTNGILSGDGKYLFFDSLATNLDGGAGSYLQVFRKNLSSGEVEMVSTLSDGTTEGDNISSIMSVSDDGNLVVFRTYASNFSSDVSATDTNGTYDLFIKNMTDNSLQLVSKNVSASLGTGDASSYKAVISGGGSTVVFESSANDLWDSNADNSSDDTNTGTDIFIYDVATQKVSDIASVDSSEVLMTTSSSYNPSISTDGRYVVFESDATAMVTGDTNGFRDIFRRDLTTGDTIRVNTTSASAEATGNHSYNATISDDGDFVVFESLATNLVSGVTSGSHVYIKQISTGYISVLDAPAAGTVGDSNAYQAHISSDGKSIMFYSSSTNLVPADGNASSDIFMVANPFSAETGGGNDTLNGGAGDDTLVGGSGNDTYEFNTAFGLDTIDDHSGTDTIKFDDEVIDYSFTTVNDITAAQVTDMEELEVLRSGNDLHVEIDTSNKVVIVDQYDSHSVETVTAGDETFTLSVTSSGTAAGEVLIATSSADQYLYGFAGDDAVFGNAGNDYINGGAGDDFLKGDYGNDTLVGEDGVDVLLGEEGNDLLDGGAGSDFLHGGAGADTFSFNASSGIDRINDFTTGTDKIKIDFATFSITVSTASPIQFEDITGTYDGTNASAGSNVILDDNGDLYVDNNGTAAGGYSVVANVGAATVASGDIEDV